MIFILSQISFCERRIPTKDKISIKFADSILIYYYLSSFVTFSDITAEDVREDPLDSYVVIGDTVTLKMLTEKKNRLRSSPDSLIPNVDVRVKLIYYQSFSQNDTLYVSMLPGHNMQLNRYTQEPDSLFWVDIRDVICERDSVFRFIFQDSSGY